jgi:hypothetical protein
MKAGSPRRRRGPAAGAAPARLMAPRRRRGPAARAALPRRPSSGTVNRVRIDGGE